MITIIRGCVATYIFFRIRKFEFLANFFNFSAFTLKKKSTVLDGFFPYIAQIITSMRGCVTYKELRPWPISSRSFGRGLENRVRSVASPVLDGFFPYLVQMINSMRGCVACDDPWPWPISSRSFGLDLENRVRSVVSTVVDGFFVYMAQIITIITGCVACYVFVFQNLKIWILANFKKFSALTLKKWSTVVDGFFPYLAQMITSMRGCVAYNDLWPWPISSRSFGLGLENRVRSVPFTVRDGFFPYLVQMITGMRRCVACDDLWPWPISSRSFDLDFENRVRSVTFSVLDRLFPYLPQIITTIRECVTCQVYNNMLIFKIFRLSPWKKFTILLAFFPYLAQIIISIRGCVACNDLYLPRYKPDPFHICISYQATWEGVPRVKVIVKCLNLNFWQIFGICNFDFVLLWHGIWYKCIVWGSGGYSQNAGVLVVLVGIDIGWDCLSCNGFWAHMTDGNFHHFQRSLTIPLHSPNGRQFVCH